MARPGLSTTPDLEALEAREEAAGPGRAETRGRLLTAIRALYASSGSLTCVHRTHAALYARARRAFGSWRGAVVAAGLDYTRERDESLRRGLSLRDQRRELWRVLARYLVDRPAADDAALAAEHPELTQRVRRCWGGLAAAREWNQRNRRP